MITHVFILILIHYYEMAPRTIATLTYSSEGDPENNKN
jgi:hypothetical protein